MAKILQNATTWLLTAAARPVDIRKSIDDIAKCQELLDMVEGINVTNQFVQSSDMRRDWTGIGLFWVILSCLTLISLALAINRWIIEAVMPGVDQAIGSPLSLLLGWLPAFLTLTLINSVFALYEVLERGEPATISTIAQRYQAGFGFNFLYYFASVPVWQAMPWIRAALGVEPLMPAAWLSAVPGVAIILYVFIFDFFFYWFHRLSHRWSLLWRCHAIHHAIRAVNCWNSYHHWSEEYWRLLAINLPVLLVIELSPNDAVAAATVVGVWGQYLHQDARRLALPSWLRPLLADNVYHHCHHSLRPEHQGKNFCAFLPVWDWLFGTRHLPHRAGLPATGLAGQAPVASVGDYCLRPFVLKR